MSPPAPRSNINAATESPMPRTIYRFVAARLSLVACSILTTLWIGASVPPAYAELAPIGAGDTHYTISVGGADLTVFTYRPTNCANPALLLVFHGLGQNADGYRDHAHPIADRLCMIVVAPLFDKKRFPVWRYQQGGIVHRGAIQPSNAWTGQMILEIVDLVRRTEGRQVDYYLLGHSAGGQFLSRLAAFVPTEAKRIVIANPSTYVFPSLSTMAPFGFGGVYAAGADETELQRYLALPLTIYLGKEDTGDEDRNDSPEAVAQGKTRYERGHNMYQAGRDLAQSRGWTFNWRLVEVPGVGHTAGKMFAAPQALAALGFQLPRGGRQGGGPIPAMAQPAPGNQGAGGSFNNPQFADPPSAGHHRGRHHGGGPDAAIPQPTPGSQGAGGSPIFPHPLRPPGTQGAGGSSSKFPHPPVRGGHHGGGHHGSGHHGGGHHGGGHHGGGHHGGHHR